MPGSLQFRYSADGVKKNKMYGARSLHSGQKGACVVLVRKILKEGCHLEDLDVDGRILR
jgi:hypothetical protein